MPAQAMRAPAVYAVGNGACFLFAGIVIRLRRMRQGVPHGAGNRVGRAGRARHGVRVRDIRGLRRDNNIRYRFRGFCKQTGVYVVRWRFRVQAVSGNFPNLRDFSAVRHDFQTYRILLKIPVFLIIDVVANRLAAVDEFRGSAALLYAKSLP